MGKAVMTYNGPEVRDLPWFRDVVLNIPPVLSITFPTQQVLADMARYSVTGNPRDLIETDRFGLREALLAGRLPWPSP